MARSGPGKPPVVTGAELVCLAVAQVLLRYDDERHWLRAAASRVGHLFPRLLRQSEYNQRLKNAARLMEAALRWLADQTPGSAEMLRLMDATPIPCGHSVITARRSDLSGWAGYGYCPSHSRWYWGAKLLLIVTCDGTARTLRLPCRSWCARVSPVTSSFGGLWRQPLDFPGAVLAISVTGCVTAAGDMGEG
ncbi:MAG: hypothetical protein ACM3ML_30930 [Micromonosporaceae bacterium]